MSSSFWYSLLGHVLIGGLFFVSLPSFQKTQTPLDSVPIFIDLKDVEVSDRTNLPAKSETKSVQKTMQSRTFQQKKAEAKKIESKSVAKKEKIASVQKSEPVKDAAKIVEKAVEKEKNVVPKSKPILSQNLNKIKQKKEIPIRPKPQQDDGLDSLLASVEKMSKAEKKTKNDIQKENVSDLISGILNGVEGGKTTENFGTKLTVSETDFIATIVRKYWNIDAGIDGVENMIVDLRVSLNRDGSVSDVEFLNKNRYNQDSSFRSVAESAKRAVLISDKMGDESPFRKLAMKYPGNYSEWQKLQLRFNPLDGGVF